MDIQRVRRVLTIGFHAFHLAALAGVVLLFVLVFLSLTGTGFLWPSRRLAEYQARYGDIVAKTREMAEARLQDQREALAAARAALPADAPIPANWDFHDALLKAWLPVEEETLSNLAQVTLRGTWDRPKDDEVFRDLEERLRRAREAGNITELEARFDPNVASREVVLDRFRDYVLNAPFLDQLETAIDLGLSRIVSEEPFQPSDGDFEVRRGLASDLLASRALALAEGANPDGACKTCMRVYTLAQLSEDEAGGIDWYAIFQRHHADQTLGRLLHSSPVSPHWRAAFLDVAERQRNTASFADKLRIGAVHEYLDFQGTAGARSSGFGLYEAYEQAEALIALLDRPLYESATQLKDIEKKGESFLSQEDRSERGSTWLMALKMMTMGVDQLWTPMIIEELVRACKTHALASMEPDLMRVAFALADYRQANGRYPASLDLLIPQWLERIPVDPVTGATVAYEPDEKGYRLTVPPWEAERDTPQTVWLAR